MACKLCNKSLYFDTNWYHSDGGYGDDDYGGIDIHTVVVRICPNCGEVRLPEAIKKSSPEIQEKFVKYVLSRVFANNLKYFTDYDEVEDNLYDKVDEVIGLAKKNYSEKLLKLNELTFEKGVLKCKCGEILSKGVDVNDALMELSLSDTNFCRVCGKNVKDINYNIKEEDLEATEYYLESKKTWDKRD